MILALGQIDPVVGDIAGNCAKIRLWIEQSRSAGADLIVFPELAVSGYPPKDLLLKPRFVSENARAVDQLAESSRGGAAVLVGFVRRNPSPVGRPVHNSLALLVDGCVVDVFDKCLLPTYDVFDEDRYFEAGRMARAADLKLADGSVRIGITICEDLWNDARLVARRLYHANPIEELSAAGVQLIVNASASPYEVNKQAFRERLLGGQAAGKRVPLAFVNQVGGNDELIFDGASGVFDAQGRLMARAEAFREDLLVVDVQREGPNRVADYPDSVASVWEALALGTRDYVEKCRFRDVVVGLSGGIDSAVTAAIAAQALGSPRVHGIAMPSRYSSDHSIADARLLAANLDIDFQIIPIGPLHTSFEDHLAPFFQGRAPDMTEENIQARLRGNILMALSNKFGWLLLTTGNKSELAVGYCTLYGDMCGGLAVISDVPKTMVYQLAHYCNQRAGREVIPASSINKPPSAELKPNQTDQDSLPPYEVLDAILHCYVEEEKSAEEITQLGFDAAIVHDVVRKVDTNEYKRKQAATGLKVTSRAFGVGRRMPIAARMTWSAG